MSVAVAPLVWIAVWIVRAVVRSRNGGTEPPATRREEVDAPLTALIAIEGYIVVAAGLRLGWLVFLLAPLVFAFGPPWVLWRVCLPRGWRRAGRAVQYLCWTGRYARAGRRRLFEWGLPGAQREAVHDALPVTFPSRKDAGIVPADGWTACAVTLRAEAEGAPERAERLLRGVLDLPARVRLPRAVEHVGFEQLALRALARGDWPSVLARAGAGRGRGCRFLRLLARARVVGDVPARWLWLAWLLAPARRRHRAWVKDALAAPPPLPRPAAVVDRGATAWSAHLLLLDAATRGDRIERAAVLDLAGRWDGLLDGPARAGLMARGLELGLASPPAAADAVGGGVRADLEALAAVAEGPWPSEWPGCEDGLAADVFGAAEDRLYQDVEEWVEGYRGGEGADIGFPLVEWDRWLRLRTALERLEEALGEEALATAWHGGLRQAAWNWPCRLLERHGIHGAWACRVMFEWTVALADRFGDEEAAAVNRRNAVAALQQAPPG
jgi:hypothetical protein